MKTDSDLDRQLRSILREELDHEVGPDPTWAESPAARRVAGGERRARYRWPLRILAGAALIGAIGGAAVLGGALDEPPANGWIAFAARQPGDDPSSWQDDDLDIWFVALDQEARRVIGSDTDRVRQLCPAFSPDGRSLAYGRVEGHGTEYFVSADGVEGSRPPDFSGAALVVADVSADGRVSDRQTIDIGDGLPPPCPVWSPDGGQVAFGVNLTSPINPTRSAAGSEVWIVTLADGSITALPDLLATDLEWSPDGSQLAIASGMEQRVRGNRLHDGRISLYEPSSGALRQLDATLGATELTWSPDSRFIAYMAIADMTGDSSHELRIIDVETGSQQEVLAPPFGAFHGIGPVWSPDGETIVYQRVCGTNPVGEGCRNGGERHEVVLVTPGDLSDESAVPSEAVIPPPQVTVQGSDYYLYPYRVTWSPDGEYLLYVAWGGGQTASEAVIDPLIAAVPTDPEVPPVVIALSENIVAKDGDPDSSGVPIQTWGRQSSD